MRMRQALAYLWLVITGMSYVVSLQRAHFWPDIA